MKFDLSKYKNEDEKNINLKQTKKNIGIFMSAYFSSRYKVGYPRTPRITSVLSPTPFSTDNRVYEPERLLIEKEENIEEFKKLNDLFVSGFIAINHPFNPEITERRRKIFFDRYINGLSVVSIMDKYYLGKTTISEETKKGVIQFAEALDIATYL